MPRWWKDTITVYHQSSKIENGKRIHRWSSIMLTGCFFDTQDAQALTGNTLSMASSYVVRIPFKGQRLDIVPGDIIVRGRVHDIIVDEQGKRATDLLQKYKPDCFTVRTVSDNTKIQRLAHYKLAGV